MKKILIIGLLVVFSSVMFACSSDVDSQKCSAWMLSDDLQAKTVAVTCSPPLNVMDIYGLSREKVEALLGPQREDMPNSERVGYYNGGGVEVVYDAGAVIYIALLPENLPMNSEAILKFVGLTGQLGAPLPGFDGEPNVGPTTNITWDEIPGYPRVSVNSDENKPEIVQSINVGMF